MKFARGFFTCILIILASHGAYQLYKQHFKTSFQVSDDVRTQLQSAGIDINEMADENGVTNLFSDTANFGVGAGNTSPSSMPPSFFNSPGNAVPNVPSPQLQPPPPKPPLMVALPTPSQTPQQTTIQQAAPQQNLPLAFPLPVSSSPAQPYTNNFDTIPTVPEPAVTKQGIHQFPVPDAQPFPEVTEKPGFAMSASHRTIPGADENVTQSVVDPVGHPVTDAPMVSDNTAVAGIASNIAMIDRTKPNDTPGMNSIVPSPIMIDNHLQEAGNNDNTETPVTSVIADNLPLQEGFAMSEKNERPTEDILQVNSMSSVRPYDAVTPLPEVLDENDKSNIVGDIRKEIIDQCQAILKSFDSQDAAIIKGGYIELSRLYFNKNLTPEEQRYVAAPLSRVAGGLFFSNQMHILEPPYTVKEGESMDSLAADLQVTPELLWKINGFAPQTNLQPGMQIKIIRGPLEAKVKPKTCELLIMSDGRYVCRFLIGVGLNYAGQRGSFTVEEKTVNPTYDLGFGLDRIEANNPNNPLGCRWIKLSRMANNIGIHGTNRPDLVGDSDRTMVPPGVFFMKNEDVIEVCDMLVPGSPVVIER